MATSTNKSLQCWSRNEKGLWSECMERREIRVHRLSYESHCKPRGIDVRFLHWRKEHLDAATLESHPR